MQFVAANPAAKVTGEEELPGKINYLIGKDPSKWRTGVATYAKVRYEQVYPGSTWFTTATNGNWNTILWSRREPIRLASGSSLPVRGK